MFIKGEMLRGTITLGFAIHGERGQWTISVSGPGGIVIQDETVEATWYPLLNEMLAAALDAARRKRFPMREAHREAQQ